MDTTNKTKLYHVAPTGQAATTLQNHQEEDGLKLYGGCFCPFVQRVWISLEAKRMSYQYIEIDPYDKTPELLQLNRRGLVPALRHGDWSSHESSVLMEYVEDISDPDTALLPRHAQARADARLWTDHINRHVIPSFYRYLQAQDEQKQTDLAVEFNTALDTLVDAADRKGPFFAGSQLSFVDVQVAPWLLRLRRVLSPYRGWPATPTDTRLGQWIQAIEENEAVKATTSDDRLYLESYRRYAENLPSTSKVADAINSGRGLP